MSVPENTDELTQKLVMIVASGILGYTRMLELLKHDRKTVYIPPTKEEVIWEYQNIPFFNRTVDAIVSSLHAIRHDLSKVECFRPPEPSCIYCKLTSKESGRPLFMIKAPGQYWQCWPKLCKENKEKVRPDGSKAQDYTEGKIC